MTSFDAVHFHPPAPVAQVALRNAATGAADSAVLLLLDTRADVTLVPRAAVERIGVEVDAAARIELSGFDGSRSFAAFVILDLLLLERTFRGNVLVTDAKRGILGRDVLNHFVLLIDGPNQQWSQATP